MKLTKTVLVTGAAGFIGNALALELPAKGYKVIAGVRSFSPALPNTIEQIAIGDLSGHTRWSEILTGIDVIVHTAARVHVFNDNSNDPMGEFLKINTDATLNLARAAANTGVKRFIFLSSVGIYGNSGNRPFTEEDVASPQSMYALSKHKAEQGLLALAGKSDMKIIIIRPPLVYGPNAPGNFRKLLKLIDTGLPLPFSAVNNRRSFIALANLLSFIALCIEHADAADETFLVSDGEDISTRELIIKISRDMGKKPWLIPIPVGLFRFLLQLMGKRELAIRLFDSMQVDNRKARDLLGWHPTVSTDEEINKTVKAYLNEKIN